MRMTLPCSLLLSAAVVALQPVSSLMAQTTGYDPTADFCLTNGNPNGVWSYGWMPVGFGPLTLLTNAISGSRPQWGGWAYDSTPAVWKNLDTPVCGVPTGWLSLHPGPGNEPVVLRWTAPTTCAVDLQGQFLPGDGGAMQVAVRLNSQPWWNATDSGSFSLQASVAMGATVDFMAYGGYYYGNTPFTVLISVGGSFSLNVERSGTSNVVSFVAPADGTYVLESAPSLAPPIQWSDVCTNSLSSNECLRYTESPSAAAGFYRARRMVE